MPEDLLRELAIFREQVLGRLELQNEQLRGEIRALKQTIADMKDDADDHVTQEEFGPVKGLVYGTVKIILGLVVVGLVGLLIAAQQNGGGTG